MTGLEAILLRVPERAFYMLPILGALQILVYAIVRKRLELVIFAVLLTGFLILVYQPLAAFIPYLSRDSFREGLRFDLQEGLFYLKTLRSTAYAGFGGVTLAKWLAAYLVYGAAFLVVIWMARRISWAGSGLLNLIAILILILPFMGYSAWRAARGFADANADIALVEKNFAPASGLFEVSADPNNDLAVVLYIGESTARVNWGLYGYPRNTTPSLDMLQRQGKLIRFDHVSATFPYTSNSLLDALAIEKLPHAADAQPVPIFAQPRLSIVDVLAEAGIRTSLYSNQSRYGSWNLASKIIFRDAHDSYFTTGRVLGNLDYIDDRRPFDHQFLRRFLSDLRDEQTAASRLLVFHSYAGHGGYADFVPPEYRRPVDDFFRGLSAEAVLGSDYRADDLADIESYDAAMRYVSDNVARSIREMDASDRPMVLVYFADHGESPFTGVGHDVARFDWTMIAVPLVMHFNPAAQRKYPALAARYRERAAAARDASLANLSSLVVDLLGVRVRYPDGSEHRASQCGFALGNCMPRQLVVQKLIDGALTFVAPPASVGGNRPHATDVSDRLTAQYNLVRELAGAAGTPQVCPHRSNSLARVIQARAISDCLELDVVVSKQGQIEVYHPPSPNVGLSLDRALSALGDRPTTVWLDAKNIDAKARCASLASYVSRTAGRNVSFFVEFPPTSAARVNELRDCSAALHRAKVARSYYVPTELAVRCAEETGRKGVKRACRQLETVLSRVGESGLFTDLSFDFLAFAAIRQSPAAAKLRWNTWSVPDNVVRRMRNGKFRLVIPEGSVLNFN